MDQLVCSTCRRELPDCWFSARKDGICAKYRRGRGYICKTCKRKMDRRLWYKRRIIFYQQQVLINKAKLKALIEEIGPGRVTRRTNGSPRLAAKHPGPTEGS